MSIYLLEDRAKTRAFVQHLNDLAKETKEAARAGRMLPDQTEAVIVKLTQVTDRSRQVDALLAIAESVQKQHLARLAPLAPNDFNAFCEYVNPDEAPASKWHIWLTQKLQEIEEDDNLTRFILNCPPGHAKSTYASRLFVAWRLGRNPKMKVIGGGHSQRFVENEFSKKIRSLVGSPEYQTVFPELKIDYSTRAADQWAIAGTGGQYVAKGVGQAVHGFRANFACVDDPYAQIEEAESPVQREKVNTWFVGDIGSRMLPFAKTFLIMTRFHEDDLTGYLMKNNHKHQPYDRWHQVEAPALCIDPETDILGRKLGEVLWDYYNLDYFVTKKAEWTFQRFSLVYQQNPSATAEGNVSSKFQFYDKPPHKTPEAIRKARAEGHVDDNGRVKPNRRAYFRRVILSVDTATKVNQRADYTVIQTWGETHDRRYYLLRQTREKVEFEGLIELIEKQAKLDEVDQIVIEDKGNGTTYVQTRGLTANHRRLAPAPIVPIDPKGQSKEFRFDEVTPLITGGEVYLPRNADWLDGFLKEFGQFPESAHDDQVDATTQALKYLKGSRTRFGSRTIGSFG